MVEDRKYFRLKRAYIRRVALGLVSGERQILNDHMFDRIQYDTGKCSFSLQEGSRILKASNFKHFSSKKVANELEKARVDGDIEYSTAKGKHSFEIKLNIYYPIEPSKTAEKEQVEFPKEQVKEQVKTLSNQEELISEKNRLGNRSVGSNTIKFNKVECNEIEDNAAPCLFGFPIPDDIFEKYELVKVAIMINRLHLEHKSNPPRDPIALLRDSLEKASGKSIGADRNHV